MQNFLRFFCKFTFRYLHFIFLKGWAILPKRHKFFIMRKWTRLVYKIINCSVWYREAWFFGCCFLALVLFFSLVHVFVVKFKFVWLSFWVWFLTLYIGGGFFM